MVKKKKTFIHYFCCFEFDWHVFGCQYCLPPGVLTSGIGMKTSGNRFTTILIMRHNIWNWMSVKMVQIIYKAFIYCRVGFASLTWIWRNSLTWRHCRLWWWSLIENYFGRLHRTVYIHTREWVLDFFKRKSPTKILFAATLWLFV